MAITGATIVSDAMYQAGVLGQDQGTAAPDADAQLVLRRLNRMLDSWSNERLMIHNLTTESFTMNAGQAVYSSSLLSARPVQVNNCYVTYGGVAYQVAQIDNQRYGSIAIKNVNAIPGYLYIDASVPDMTFTFFPIPFATMTCSMDLQQLLTGSIAMATNLIMPPGYEKAIVDCLAVDICPSFDREPTMQMLKSAQQARSVLKTTNYVGIEASTDFDRDDSFALSSIYKPW